MSKRHSSQSLFPNERIIRNSFVIHLKTGSEDVITKNEKSDLKGKSHV
jgi:hypothetical protein